MSEPLEPVDVRVLGSLMEKQFTTPDNYPLTLNALTAACNQTSNRDPVMDLDERTVARSLEALGRRGLARAVHRGDSRVLRYRQEVSDALHLHPPELAILCVLLLRGPQTTGEIRTRTARMFEFVDLRHVEITLDALVTLSTPLVVQLPRRPGQKEARWAHLLAGEPVEDAAPQGAAAGEPGGVSNARDERTGGAPTAAERAVGERTGGAPTADERTGSAPAPEERVAALEREVAALRAEVVELRAHFESFRRQFE